MLDREVIFDCLIIGAGQVGLSAGRYLQSAGLNFAILERGESAGAEWMHRAPEHLLFTPRKMSKLPGLEMPAGPTTQYPTNHEMGAYFAEYAKVFDLPVYPNSNVVQLSKANGFFQISLTNGSLLQARSVILANGSNQVSHIPAALAEPVVNSCTQSTGRDFWKETVPHGSRILVVGDGASGRQTALDYAAKGYETTLSGANRRLAPAKILGKSLFSWLLAARLLRADRDTLRAKLLRYLNPVPSKKALGDKSLRHAGVKIKPKLVKTLPAVGSDKKKCANGIFKDGSKANFDHITWCVGYTEDSQFNTFAAGKHADWYTQGRGKTEVPGLFISGRIWLSSRASELILGAPFDARRAADAVLNHLEKRQIPNDAIKTNQVALEV